MLKTFSDKFKNFVKIHCAVAFSLGTIITHMSSFDHKLIQIKLANCKVILLSEVSHVGSKSNHANELKKR